MPSGYQRSGPSSPTQSRTFLLVLNSSLSRSSLNPLKHRVYCFVSVVLGGQKTGPGEDRSDSGPLSFVFNTPHDQKTTDLLAMNSSDVSPSN